MTTGPGTLTRTPVDSSSVASVGYSAETQALEVQFRSGSVYRYFNVPASIYSEFMASPSKGTFFNTSVRMQFGFARV